MSITIDGGAGITFPDAVQQTNGMTMTGGNPLYYAARAWVVFSGSSRAILASANVSSVTDLGTGESRVNFTTSMPSASYSVACAAYRAGSVNNVIISYGATAVGSVPVYTFTVGNTYIDATTISVAIFR